MRCRKCLVIESSEVSCNAISVRAALGAVLARKTKYVESAPARPLPQAAFTVTSREQSESKVRHTLLITCFLSHGKAVSNHGLPSLRIVNSVRRSS